MIGKVLRIHFQKVGQRFFKKLKEEERKQRFCPMGEESRIEESTIPQLEEVSSKTNKQKQLLLSNNLKKFVFVFDFFFLFFFCSTVA
jgi:hypothetical protein